MSFGYHGSKSVVPSRTANLDEFLTGGTTSTLKQSTTRTRTDSGKTRPSSAAARVSASSRIGSASQTNGEGSTRPTYEEKFGKGLVLGAARNAWSDDRSQSPLTGKVETDANVSNGSSDDKSQLSALLDHVASLRRIDIESIQTELKERSRDKYRTQLQEKIQECAALQEKYENMTSKCKEAEDKNQQIITEVKGIIKETKEKAVRESEEKNQRLREKVRQREEEIKQLRVEKENALSRLSKQMGEKLNNENSGIADLSDPNRSTKIAEKYNSLYDNEWTDALESLSQSLDEETGVRFLLEIKKHIYSFCTKARSEMLEKLHSVLENPLSSTQRYVESTDQSTNNQIKQMLDACVKAKTNQIIENLNKEYTKLSNKPRFADRLPEYTNKCMEVCWLMNIHSPPLVFAETVSSGQTYDKDLYREFTKQGEIVSFVVWLPMLIEHGGAVLSKGVVQPVPSAKPESKRGASAASKTRKTRENRETHDEQFRRMLQEEKPETNYLEKYGKDFSATGIQESSTADRYNTDYSPYQKGSDRYSDKYTSKDKIYDAGQSKDPKTDYSSGASNAYDYKYSYERDSKDNLKSKTYNVGYGHQDRRVDEIFQGSRGQRSGSPSTPEKKHDVRPSYGSTTRQETSPYSTRDRQEATSYSTRDRQEATSYGTRDRQETTSYGSADRQKTSYTDYTSAHQDPGATIISIPRHEMFEHKGRIYALHDNQLYINHSNSWIPTNKFN